MVKRSGAGSKSGDGSADFRNRIEGFGNGPMPPPVSENFEDRLHDALTQDENWGEWYTSARVSMDAMITSFDDTVNAIADTIEDTIGAVVGDDDVWDPEPPQSKKQHERKRSHKAEKDDGERSDVKWPDEVGKICEEGDLENFVLLVRSQCANNAEEREVAGLLSENLLQADNASNTLRVLYVMQAVEEGDLPVVIDAIRLKCQAKLDKLKTQVFFKALAAQVLGPGPSSKAQDAEKKTQAKNGEKKHEDTQAEASKPAPKPPIDLLDVNDSAKPASSSQGKAASSSGMVDLLDMASPAKAAAGPPQDLLSLEVTPMLQPTVPAAAPMPGNSISFLQPIPGPAASAASTSLNLFPAAAAPQPAAAGQWADFQIGGPSSAPASKAASQSGSNLMALGQPFGTSQPFGAMSSMSGSGYQQGFSSPPLFQASDSFDPNAKSSVSSGPQIKVTGAGNGMHDAFSNLDPFGLPSNGQPSNGNSAGNSGNSSTTGRKNAAQPSAKMDALQLDDVFSTELAKMKLVT